MATSFLIIAIVSWILITLILPVSIFVSDSCKHADFYMETIVDVYGDQLELQAPIDISLQIENMDPLSIALLPSQIMQTVLRDCKGVDPVQESIATTKSYLSTVRSHIVDVAREQSKSYKVKEDVFQTMDNIFHDFQERVEEFINEVSNGTHCPVIRDAYSQVKDAPCKTGIGVLGSFWLIELLMALLMMFGSVASTILYCFFKCNNRKQIDVIARELNLEKEKAEMIRLLFSDEGLELGPVTEYQKMKGKK